MRSILGFLIFVGTMPLYSQDVGVIQGTVTNAATGSPLIGANIVLEKTPIGSATGEDGSFTLLNVPPGVYTITASFVGFERQSITVTVTAGLTLTVDFALRAEAIRIHPVIVTATTARERETPVTFSNMTSEHLRNTYLMHDAPSVLAELPSVLHHSWEGNDIGYSFLNIRGFDQRRIAVMINGIPQNDPEDHNVYWIDMPDLLGYTENIQVQRGAGSMFYGPPAIGGSINIITTPVLGKPRVSVTSAFGFQEYGDRDETILNTRKYALSVHSGLIEDKYFFFGNLSTIRSSGYRSLGWTDLKSYFLGAARFDEGMTTRIHIFGGPVDHGLAYFGIPKFYNTKERRRTNYNFFLLTPTGDDVLFTKKRKPQEKGTFFQPHYELLHEWKLSSDVTLHNTLFYIQGDGSFDYDGDWVAYPDPVTGQPTAAIRWFREKVGYDSTFGSTRFPSMILRGFVGNKQWGWLPRIEIDHGSGKLTLGGELRIHRSIRWGKIQWAEVYPPNYNPDFHFYEYNGEKDILSLYAHEVYRLDGRTTVMGDLQLAYNRYGVRNEKFLNTTFSVPYVFVNPRFGINHNLTDELNAYVSIGYTSREPRLFNLYNGEEAWFGITPNFEKRIVNGRVEYDFTKPLLKPERLLNIELGAGYTTTEGKVGANVFWMEFFNELIKSGRLDIFGRPETENADRTRHIGIELEVQQRFLDSFEVSGNLTLSRNRLVRFATVRPGTTDEIMTLDGNPIAGFPDVLGKFRITYRLEAVRVSLLAKHVGSFYTDNFKRENRRVDPYTIFDLDVGFTLPQLLDDTELTIFGKVRNLFNKLYLAGGEGTQFFPAAERSFYVGVNVGF